MKVSIGRVPGGMGGGGSATGAVEESTGMLSGLLSGLPSWAAALLTTLFILIIAAILGMIIGKLYASVKYPDPEKHSVLPPLVRIGFICLVAACSVWLFGTLMKQPGDDLMVGGDPSSPSFEVPPDGELENPEDMPSEEPSSDEAAEEPTGDVSTESPAQMNR